MLLIEGGEAEDHAWDLLRFPRIHADGMIFHTDAVGLITGIQLRAVALSSCLLLLTFALCMTFGTGPEGPLSFSVWTASAASLLLATHPQLRTPAAT